MKNILVIGSTGQIGSELTMKLRSIYGNDHVVAGYITGQEPTGILLESGPSALCDVTDGEAIAAVVKQYNIDAIYNLAALLSVVAERKPLVENRHRWVAESLRSGARKQLRCLHAQLYWFVWSGNAGR